MERYFFYGNDSAPHEWRAERLAVYDRRGLSSVAIAQCTDPDVAERLVRLLNEDERRKAHTAFLRGFARELAKEYGSAGK